MLKRLIAAAVFLLSAAQAHAVDFSDVYYNPSESGWGMFLVQSDVTQFVALFIYGNDNKPTWYTATLKQDAAGNSVGQLAATTGSYFALPWNSNQLTVNSAAGTIAIQPIDAYHVKVTYAVSGIPGTVIKTVQRQSLTDHKLAGSYSGALSGTNSSCPNPDDNNAHSFGTFDLAVVQTAATATLTVTFTDADDKGLVCTLQGPLTLFGRTYRIADAQLTCMSPGGAGGSVLNVEGLHPTAQGIEFRLVGKDPTGCAADLHFAAVLRI